MALILETAPAVDPVTLEEVKEHLRIDGDDDDSLLGNLIRAASERFDGRDGALGRCLISQSWKLVLDAFPQWITIPLPPCQVVEAITYVDAFGDLQTLASDAYQVSGIGSIDGATVRPAYQMDWPKIRQGPDAVTVHFTAGYGDSASDVPEPVRTAIKMRVAHLYENRESISLGDHGSIVPYGETDLIRNHKTWSF